MFAATASTGGNAQSSRMLDPLPDVLRHRTVSGAVLADREARLRPEVRKRQALARKGTDQHAPPGTAHIWARDLMFRAIRLPGIRGLVQRSIQRASR